MAARQRLPRARRVRNEQRSEFAFRRRAHGAARDLDPGGCTRYGAYAGHRLLRAQRLGAAHGARDRARLRGRPDAASLLLQGRIRRGPVQEFRRGDRARRRCAPAALPLSHPSGIAGADHARAHRAAAEELSRNRRGSERFLRRLEQHEGDARRFREIRFRRVRGKRSLSARQHASGRRGLHHGDGKHQPGSDQQGLRGLARGERGRASEGHHGHARHHAEVSDDGGAESGDRAFRTRPGLGDGKASARRAHARSEQGSDGRARSAIFRDAGACGAGGGDRLIVPPGRRSVASRLNHVAIASDQYALNGRFYESLFGMKPSSKPRPARSVVLGDGYVGMNVIPRRDGRTSGLDHFGIEVDDVEDTIARIAKFDSSLGSVKRPPIRPFAAYSAHDPDTNIFDLSQKGSGGQKDVYAENDWVQPRTISHIALRTRHAERCSQFYADVFGLAPLDRPKDGNFYLSDGRVRLMIIPWIITDYYGQDPARTGLDHIGFKVESVDRVKKDMEFLIGENPHMRTRALGYGSEGEARLKLFQKCPLGSFHLTDIEGVHIDVAE